MIVRERPNGLRLFFIVRGAIAPRIKGPLAATILIAVLVTAMHGELFHQKITLTPIPFSLIGLALAIFLGFRNSASYDRYWEGRQLWGDLIVHSRTIARQLQAYSGASLERRRWLGRRLTAYAYLLAHHLRGTDADSAVAQFLDPDEWAAIKRSPNRPDALMRRISAALALERPGCGDILFVEIERHLSALAAIQGGCERIKSTPLPFSYTLLLHRTAYLYCFSLPFGLVDSIGFMTPFVVAIIAYTFFGLDALGDEIEEPFGMQPNDLPLTALCRTVEIDMLAALGEDDLPAPLEPQKYCLM